MSLDMIKQINKLLPAGASVNTVKEAANLLGRTDIDSRIKDQIAPMLIGHLVVRNVDLDFENQHLLAENQRLIKDRNLAVIKAKRDRVKDKSVLLPIAGGGSTVLWTAVGTAIFPPLGLAVFLGGSMLTVGVTAKTQSDRQKKVPKYDALEILIRNGCTMEEAKKIYKGTI